MVVENPLANVVIRHIPTHYGSRPICARFKAALRFQKQARLRWSQLSNLLWQRGKFWANAADVQCNGESLLCGVENDLARDRNHVLKLVRPMSPKYHLRLWTDR